MCSYNKYHSTWACESGTLLNDLLKNELDFQGYVMSGMSPTDLEAKMIAYTYKIGVLSIQQLEVPLLDLFVSSLYFQGSQTDNSIGHDHARRQFWR